MLTAMEVNAEDIVRKWWKHVDPPDSKGRINLGVLTYHARTHDPQLAWKRLAEYTEVRVRRVRELQEDIDQVELEIAVNSNAGTAINPRSEQRWAEKNRRWERIANRLKDDLNSLTQGMKGWRISGDNG